MSRYHIIAALVLVAVVAALGLTYKFYFEEKLKAYGESEKTMETLTKRLSGLQQRFHGQMPDEYLPTINEAINPLNEAVLTRRQFFNLNDFWTDETIPEDVKVPMKFYYQRTYQEKWAALQNDAMAHVPPISYPLDLFDRFGAPHPDSLADVSVGKDDVQRWLTQVNFGVAITRMLIKANVGAITNIVLWPPRNEYSVLQMRTVGLSFVMRAEDLVPFLDSLERADRYFNVNAIRIQNRNLLSDPRYPLYLEVEMLLTLSKYDETKVPKAGAPALAAGPGGPLGGAPDLGSLGLSLRRNRETAAPVAKQKSFWSKLWPF